MLASLFNTRSRAQPIIESHVPWRADHEYARLAGIDEFAQALDNRKIPVAGDGLPLWNSDTFLDPFARIPAKYRRASLRPRFELLSAYTPIDGISVGTTLRSYARMLWDVKQNKVPRAGIAIRIRLRAVYVLVGRRTRRGHEFTRRCRMINRFVNRLLSIKQRALRSFDPVYSHIVRDEVEILMSQAMFSLVNGLAFNDRSGAGVTEAIRCRIRNDQADSWLPDWLWKKFSGC